MRHFLVAAALLGVYSGFASSQEFLGKSAKEWLVQLETGDAAARRKAAFALGKLGSHAELAVAALKKCLRDGDHPKVQEAAAEALGDIAAQSIRPAEDKDLVDALRVTLKSPESPVRRAVAYALGQLGAAAAPAQNDLANALKDSNASVRQNAARALGKLGASSFKFLQSALSDPDRLVQRDTALVLADMEPATVRPALADLIKLCGIDDSEVRRAALRVVIEIVDHRDEAVGEGIKPALRDMSVEVRRQAALALAKIGGTSGQVALPVLREALAQGDSAAKQNAAIGIRFLGMGAKDLVPDLVRGLKDADVDTRKFSAFALGGLGADAEPAIAPLVKILGDAKEATETRVTAGQALQEIGPVPGAVAAAPALLKILEDPDQEVRVREKVNWALRVHQAKLGEIKGATAAFTNVLRERKQPANKMLRYDCAYLLSVLRKAEVPEEALDTLLDFLHDSSIEIYSGVKPTPGLSDEDPKKKATLKTFGKGDGRKMALDALQSVGKDRVMKRADIVEQIRRFSKSMDLDPVFRAACKTFLDSLQ